MKHFTLATTLSSLTTASWRAPTFAIKRKCTSAWRPFSWKSENETRTTNTEHQDPETEAAKWNSATIHFIIYTWPFSTVTCQNACTTDTSGWGFGSRPPSYNTAEENTFQLHICARRRQSQMDCIYWQCIAPGIIPILFFFKKKILFQSWS